MIGSDTGNPKGKPPPGRVVGVTVPTRGLRAVPHGPVGNGSVEDFHFLTFESYRTPISLIDPLSRAGDSR